MTRAVLVTGSGGVGKTTIAAALAARAAREGQQALVLTVDPARRLADALGLEHLSNVPTPNPDLPALSAAMLDAAASWEAIAYRHAPDVAESLIANPFYEAVAQRFPAGQSYAAAEEMAGYLEAGTWDLVVVDTPPAAGGIDFFEAPARMRELVGGRLLHWLTGARLPGRRGLFMFTARPALKLADAVLGGPLLEELANFLFDLRALYDGMSSRAGVIESYFRRATALVVTTADPAPMREALRFFRALPEVASDPAAVVFNRALPTEWAHSPAPGEAPSKTDRVLAANLVRWGAEARRQEDARADFAARYRTPLASVPWLPHPPTSLGDLLAMIEKATGLPPEVL